jgi:hypothetical protein
MARNQMVALDTADVAITTATITIKALKVDNRQLSQAIFRQLPERPLIDEAKVELLGLPWGWVNYEAAGMGDGRQFVAQFGEKLFRCPVRLVPSGRFWWRNETGFVPEGFGSIWQRFLALKEPLFLASALAGGQPLHKVPTPRFPVFGLQDDFAVAVDVQDSNIRSAVQRCLAPQEVTHTVRTGKGEWPYERRVVKTADEVKAEAVAKIREYIAGWGESPDLSPATVMAQMSSVCKEAMDYCLRWDRLIERLTNVEQLFIAA